MANNMSGCQRGRAPFFPGNYPRRVDRPCGNRFAAVRQVLQPGNGRGFGFQFQHRTDLTGKRRYQSAAKISPRLPDQAVGELTGSNSVYIVSVKNLVEFLEQIRVVDEKLH